ncbi:MAG: bifunctional metallophosphatase/5'-nucleotidase [Actinomycetota bacterium]
MSGTASGASPGHKFLSVIIAAVLMAGLMLGAVAPEADAKKQKQSAAEVDYWLTVLHNNDGESRLIDAGGDLTDFGGVARFAKLVEELRDKGSKKVKKGNPKKAAVLISSGDNFLAGPEFNASLERNEATGEPYYDSVALRIIGYDAMTIGNHEFDFGPDVLATFIEGFRGKTPFISANLDVSGEPSLAELEDDGIITGSTVVKKKGESIGIIGATTELLPTISSPRNVEVEAVLPAVQAEIRSLRRQDVDKIILSSHLQGIDSEIDLVGSLRNVDVVIAGGGDELLTNDGDVLVPGDEMLTPFGPYPVMATDAAGREVPVVTTPGNYKYVGKLVVGFNEAGRVVAIDDDSGLQRVAGGDQPDAVKPVRRIQRQVVQPVAESVEALANNVIAQTEVTLNGVTADVRTKETNAGNLVADSLLWQATKVAGDFGVPEPDIALQNGGGIRNSLVVDPGDITELDTFTWLPFSNFTSVIDGVERSTLKAILEHVVEVAPATAAGKFAQIAGFEFTYDGDGTAGSKINDVTLDDGTPIVTDGVVEPGPALTVATIDFLARGGDGYPFGTVDFTPVGVSYQQALANYLTAPDGLNGLVTAADYPEGGEGRIVAE